MAFRSVVRRADVLDEMVDYLVDAPDGSVGVVDGWVRDDGGRPTRMIVAQGWFGRRRIEIPVSKLAEVDHDGMRVVLSRGAAPAESEGLARRIRELLRRCRSTP
jgi:hypothetical protein